jgi:hypothetical protein
MQQLWVFLLLLGAALLASPAAAVPGPAQFVPAEVHELRRQINLQSLVDAVTRPDVTITRVDPDPMIPYRRFRFCRDPM